jgi:hypothetical protein
MTNEQIQAMRDRQINRCEAICKALDLSFHYDVCESGFTEFYFSLNDGSKHLIKRVENDFLDTEESKCLSNYAPSSQQLGMWRVMGLL